MTLDVNRSSWEKAQEDFPNFAREDRLKNFLYLPLKGKGNIPQPFRDFCQAALDGESSDHDHPPTTIKRNGHAAHFIKGNYKTVNAQGLREVIPTFQGANLIVANLRKVSTNMPCK